MTRHPDRVVKMRSVRECLCCPDVGYTCRLHDGTETQAIIEETGFPSDGPPWDVNELPAELQGYGHRRADQDGGDGSEWVTPYEDNEARMIEAARVLFDAEELIPKPD